MFWVSTEKSGDAYVTRVMLRERNSCLHGLACGDTGLSHVVSLEAAVSRARLCRARAASEARAPSEAPAAAMPGRPFSSHRRSPGVDAALSVRGQGQSLTRAVGNVSDSIWALFFQTRFPKIVLF